MLEHKCDKCGTELGYKGLCFKCKAEEERNKTLALTDDEIKEIINKYVKDLKEKNVDKELLNGIYIYDLIAYRNIDLKDIAKKALEKKIYYPEVFYYKASEEIRDELIKRIKATKDYSEGANWEKRTTPWGQRSRLSICYDENKIYVTKGERGYYELGNPYWDYKTQSFENDSTIWSSTDGVNWQVEPNSSAYDNANEIYSYSSSVRGDLPYIQNKIKTPEEPNWIKLDNGRYYKSDNSPYATYTINNKTYYVPIPPYEEIGAAYDSGQEYFTITEAHIKSAGLNQFLTKDKEPNKDEDWTVITPIDYTDKLMVWQSGGEKVMLNINNKAVQLVDYTQIEVMYNTIKEYSIVINDLRKTAKELRDGTYFDPFSGTYIKNVRAGMEYDARADMLELLKSNREYIMPDEAVTHYTVEFKY
ncbi:hypothetical protein R4J17_12860 [Brachyspira intermedia]|uniref:hypothetical protein n=1 Tax=Brachyspira intermedia TaxID=84377 RepID=UPI003003AF78